MAQIEQSDKGGKKKKGAQKKKAIHVDFTPMVDMNMLLITFFMLCTTMIQSKTVSITLPAKPDPTKNQEKVTEVDKARVMTLILDTQYDENLQPKKDADGNTIHDIYYYYGDPSEDGNVIKHEAYVGNQNGAIQGIRKIIREKNKKVMDKYDKLKQQFGEGKITKDEFDAQALELTKDSTNMATTVILKALPTATYENVISAFDELDYNYIRTYSFEYPNAADTALIKKYESDNHVQILGRTVRGAKAKK